jgi:hypothetical protein
MGVGQTSLVERRGPLARPQGIIRWPVSGTKYLRQRICQTKGAVAEVYGRDTARMEESKACKKRIEKIKISDWDERRTCV